SLELLQIMQPMLGNRAVLACGIARYVYLQRRFGAGKKAHTSKHPSEVTLIGVMVHCFAAEYQRHVPNILRPPYAADACRYFVSTDSKLGALAQTSNCLACRSSRLSAPSPSSRPSLAFRTAFFRVRIVSS